MLEAVKNYTVWTFAAVLLLIGGLIVLKINIFIGFIMIVISVGLAIKAVNTTDDMEWFGGLCLMCGLIGVVAALVSKFV